MRLASALSLFLVLAPGCDGGPAPAPFEASPDLGDGTDLTPPLAVLHGTAVDLDTAQYGAGITIRAVPLADPSSALGAVSDAAGLVQVPVPRAACGQPLELFADGQTAAGLAVLPTRRVPAIVPSCTGDETFNIFHVATDDPSDQALRTTVARELAAAGVIPAADGVSGQAFGQHWSWAMGRMIGFIPEEHFYTDGTVTMSGDGGQCHLVYTTRWIYYRNGYAKSFLDLNASTVSGGFIIICPPTFHQPLTLSATGFTDTQYPAPASFADLTVTLDKDRMVQIDWPPSQY